MSQPEQSVPLEEAHAHSPTQPRIPRNLTSAEILQGESEITITHNGEVYRLRVTRNGKLILQK